VLECCHHTPMPDRDWPFSDLIKKIAAPRIRECDGLLAGVY
jgi:hypothetical protein